MGLGVTNLKQVLASLDERIHVRENAAERQVPALPTEKVRVVVIENHVCKGLQRLDST